MNVLFDLCGGRPRKALYEATRQEHKAMIEVEKGRPLYTYAFEAVKNCSSFDRKFILAPAEMESLIEKECLPNGVYFLPSGTNPSDTLRKCWTTLKNQNSTSFGKHPNVHVTFLCGDTIFIEPETIESFSLEATRKRADVVFQVIDRRDLRGISDKVATFVFLKNLRKEITTTNLVHLNITKKKAIDSIESLLFRKDSSRILDEYYDGVGEKVMNFTVYGYKLALRKIGLPKATLLLLECFSRFIKNELEEDYIKRSWRSVIGLDLDFVFTSKPLDLFDIDHPSDLEFARQLFATRA